MKRSLIFASIASAVGFGVGYYYRVLDCKLPIVSGLSAFICSSLLWFIIVEKPNKWTPERGATAGILATITAHYLKSYIFILIANYEYWILGKQIGSLPGPPIGLIFGILAMLFYMLLSLLITGWFTVPAGALVGVLFIKWFRP